MKGPARNVSRRTERVKIARGAQRWQVKRLMCPDVDADKAHLLADGVAQRPHGFHAAPQHSNGYLYPAHSSNTVCLDRGPHDDCCCSVLAAWRYSDVARQEGGERWRLGAGAYRVEGRRVVVCW